MYIDYSAYFKNPKFYNAPPPEKNKIKYCPETTLHILGELFPNESITAFSYFFGLFAYIYRSF